MAATLQHQESQFYTKYEWRQFTIYVDLVWNISLISPLRKEIRSVHYVDDPDNPFSGMSCIDINLVRGVVQVWLNNDNYAGMPLEEYLDKTLLP